MARIRSVKPGYFTSLDTAGALSRDCRLHFAGLWTYADDHGRGIDDARLIKAAVWPLDDDIQGDEIEAMQAELEAAGRIVRYVDTSNGRNYFEVTNWHDHQKPNRPQDSSYPAPGSDQCTITGGSVNDQCVLTEDASPEGRGEEGRGEVDGVTPDGDNADAVEEQFAEFWNAYPRGPARKPGGDGPRKPALSRWRRMKPAERQAALRAVAPYRRYIERNPESPNAAHAVTWLNQERWEMWEDDDRGSGDGLSLVGLGSVPGGAA